MEIERGQFFHLLTGVHEGKSQAADGELQDQQGKGQQQTDAQRAEQDSGRFLQVVSAVGLGSESSCSHAEEAEEPVNHIEQHASHSDGSDVGSCSQMAYNADVN